MGKRAGVFLIVFVFLFALAVTSGAATKTPSASKTSPKTKTATKSKTSKAGSSNVPVTYRFRRDRKALFVYFRNLKKAKSVSYTLAYQTDGKEEGVAGTIDPASGDQATRELLFGTCSAGVCRYHPNIKNIRFEATIELLSGKILTKRYRIR